MGELVELVREMRGQMRSQQYQIYELLNEVRTLRGPPPPRREGASEGRPSAASASPRRRRRFAACQPPK